MAQLPHPPAGAGTIPLRQLREFAVRLLQQKRRARRCAAAADDRGFQNRRGDARGRKGVRDQGSSHSATDHSDGSIVLTRQRRISLLDSCGVRKPQRPSDAQPSLRRAQRRHSDDGSDNHASSRSSGQQLTILSTGMRGEPCMRQCGLGIGQLPRGVCIAVERKDTIESECLPCQHEIQILARWIAVDFDRDTTPGGGLEHDVPVRHHARPRSGHPAARVRENPNRRVLKSGEHAIRLIVVLPQLGVRRREHDIEGGRLVVGEIEVTRRVDVRLDPLQQPESAAVACVDAVDRQPLRRGFGHRHAAGDS